MPSAKQVIVMRRDLNMRTGKMIAQGAHASMKAILDLMIAAESPDSAGNERRTLTIPREHAMRAWLSGPFTKICVAVRSEEELDEIYARAQERGLICSLIVDAGLTEFAGIPTKTCCAVGPDWSDAINEVTGHLPLL